MEILFRGKRIDTGEWVYGDFYRKCGVTGIVYDYMISTRDGMTYPVIPETVGQYTGLKDKNNKNIFDGDILQAENISYTGTYGYAVIKFGEYEDCDFVDDSGYCSSGVGFYAILTRTNGIVGIERYMVATMEVIGNIHDNPELLDG